LPESNKTETDFMRFTRLASEWDIREEKYRASYYEGDFQPGAILRIDGESPLILTAPHSLNHYRFNKAKPADRWTGSGCELLGARLNAAVLTCVGPIGTLQSWEARTDPFKCSLDDLVKPGSLVIDVHGMSDTHGIDVCIGTGTNPSKSASHAADWLIAELRNYSVSINEPFSASPDYTVVSYVQRSLGSDALQIEIAASLRNPLDHQLKAGKFAADLLSALHLLAGGLAGSHSTEIRPEDGIGINIERGEYFSREKSSPDS